MTTIADMQSTPTAAPPRAAQRCHPSTSSRPLRETPATTAAASAPMVEASHLIVSRRLSLPEPKGSDPSPAIGSAQRIVVSDVDRNIVTLPAGGAPHRLQHLIDVDGSFAAP